MALKFFIMQTKMYLYVKTSFKKKYFYMSYSPDSAQNRSTFPYNVYQNQNLKISITYVRTQYS